MKTIIVVGFRIDKKRNYITGQAAMIDLFINIMKRNGYKVIPVSLNYKINSNTKVGSTSIFRVIDYMLIFSVICWEIATHPRAILYFSPVANKIGFLRDATMVYIAKIFGCKIFMQQFGCRFEEFYRTLSQRMQNLVVSIYTQATVITTEGDLARKQLAFLNMEEKIITLKNGLPEQNIIKIKEAKTYEDKKKPFVLLYLNNMIESKGYLYVLKAVNSLINEYGLNVEAIFAGKFMSVIDDKKFKNTDEAESYFRQYIHKNNLDKKIKYYPSLFGEEKAKQFLSCNVFLLPSFYIFEGQPTAVLEALAYGAVPIVSQHSLIPEMVNKDCGCFVNKKDVKSIVDTIKHLMNNPEHYHDLSKNAINRFQENYTIEVYSKKILDIISTHF